MFAAGLITSGSCSQSCCMEAGRAIGPKSWKEKVGTYSKGKRKPGQHGTTAQLCVAIKTGALLILMTRPSLPPEKQDCSLSAAEAQAMAQHPLLAQSQQNRHRGSAQPEQQYRASYTQSFNPPQLTELQLPAAEVLTAAKGLQLLAEQKEPWHAAPPSMGSPKPTS